MIGAISLGVFALIMLIAVLPIGIISAFGAGACVFMSSKSKKNIKTNITRINQKYMDLGIQDKNKIASCIKQWNETNRIINQFSNEPIREIIA